MIGIKRLINGPCMKLTKRGSNLLWILTPSPFQGFKRACFPCPNHEFGMIHIKELEKNTVLASLNFLLMDFLTSMYLPTKI